MSEVKHPKYTIHFDNINLHYGGPYVVMEHIQSQGGYMSRTSASYSTFEEAVRGLHQTTGLMIELGQAGTIDNCFEV